MTAGIVDQDQRVARGNIVKKEEETKITLDRKAAS
jgi:hypothetical protein